MIHYLRRWQYPRSHPHHHPSPLASLMKIRISWSRRNGWVLNGRRIDMTTLTYDDGSPILEPLRTRAIQALSRRKIGA